MDNNVARLFAGQQKQFEVVYTQQNIMMQSHYAFVDFIIRQKDLLQNIEDKVDRINRHLMPANVPQAQIQVPQPQGQLPQGQGPQAQGGAVPQPQGQGPQGQGGAEQFAFRGRCGCNQPIGVTLTRYVIGDKPRYLCTICNKNYAESTYRTHVKICFQHKMCPNCRSQEDEAAGP